MEIRFYDQALDSDLKVAVVAARADGKWLLCRHRERATWEFPGGHRETGEDIHETARRELWEETGATDFQLEPVAAYGLFEPGKDPSYGALFFAEIREVGARPGNSEIEENGLFDEFPEAMTYPHIQPKLMEQVRAWLDEGNFHSEEEDIFELLV